MPFEIRINREFSAAHALRLYDGSLEPMHAHDWRVRVCVAGELDRIGVVMDFHRLEALLDEVLAPMRNRTLNEVEAFSAMNPSAENVALHIARSLRLPSRVRLLSVEVWETGENSAIYRP
jgi:6-pyruvoyltetrahydropterin/6-carboxytetrahydropterin synthase